MPTRAVLVFAAGTGHLARPLHGIREEVTKPAHRMCLVRFALDQRANAVRACIADLPGGASVEHYEKAAFCAHTRSMMCTVEGHKENTGDNP